MVTAAQAKALVPVELKGLMPSHALSFDQLYQFAQVCHASGIFEDVTDVAQAFVKICRGAELGIPPTTAMQGFDLIKKRLFIKPWLIAAKINACGYGAYVVEEQTPERCAIAFRRKYPERGWVTLPLVTYTIAEAKGHGLVERSPHWKISPANMLYQRCMGRGGAMYFPELLAGIEPPPEDVEPDPDQLRRNVSMIYGDAVDPTSSSALVPMSAPLASPAASIDSPAGEAALEYIAQIEAAILAHQGQIEPWYTWAERRFKKPRTQFTAEEWQTVLQAVRDAADKNRQESPQEAQESMPPSPAPTQPPTPTDASQGPPAAPGGIQGEYLAGKDRNLFAEEEAQEYGP